MTIVLADVLPGFQRSVNSSSLTSCFFLPLKFLPFPVAVKFKPFNPTVSDFQLCLLPVPQGLSHPGSTTGRLFSISSPWALVATTCLCSFLSHPLHPRACLPAFHHFVITSLVSGPAASASPGRLLDSKVQGPTLYLLSQTLRVGLAGGIEHALQGDFPGAQV